MLNNQIRKAREVKRIDKKVKNHRFECLFADCKEYSINSHFIQRNGILSKIAVDNHFIELRQKDFFKMRESGPFLEFKRVGIKEGFSLPIFCEKHDTEIFSPIETGEVDFGKYESQLLVSYRTVCAELRKKEIAALKFQEVLDSPILEKLMDEERMAQFDSMVFGYQVGCKELDGYRIKFEQGIANGRRCFLFRTFRFKRKDLCISTVFSPDFGRGSDLLDLIQPQENVIINIFPYKEESVVIVGYLIGLSNGWIMDYTDSWDKMNDKDFEKELTNLICLRTEAWALSHNLFNQLDEERVEKMNKIITENIFNHYFKMSTDFNLFKIKG